MPIVPAKSHPIQKGFKSKGLGMTEIEYSNYWIQLKETRGEIPPLESNSDRFILKYVSKLKDAIGCVSTAYLNKQTKSSVRVILRK